MRFELTTGSSALQRALDAVKADGASCRIRTADNKVHFAIMTEDSAYECESDAVIVQTGDCLVPSRPLRALSHYLATGNSKTFHADATKLTVSGEFGEVAISCKNEAGALSAAPETPAGVSLDLTRAGCVVHAVSRDRGSQSGILTGVHVSSRGIAATDNYRIAVVRYESAVSEFTVLPSAVEIAAGLQQPVSVSASATHATFASAGSLFRAPLLAGGYPEWPPDSAWSVDGAAVAVNRLELLRLVEDVEACRGGHVDLLQTTGHVEVAFRDESVHLRLRVPSEGAADWALRVRTRYLREALEAVPHVSAVLLGRAASFPALTISSDGVDQLIMAIQVEHS